MCAQLPSDPTQSFWLTDNPLAREGANAALPTNELDVLIVGSGISGVSAAYHLASKAHGLKVAIFEARDFCSGATGRNGGHLHSAAALFFADLKRFGLEDAIREVKLKERCKDDLLQLIEEHSWAQEIDLVQGGGIRLCPTETELLLFKASVKEAEEAGLDVSHIEWLSSDDILKV
jgi:glycine/D-amino acid oxidase-like deaminating enzyme